MFAKNMQAGQIVADYLRMDPILPTPEIIVVTYLCFRFLRCNYLVMLVSELGQKHLRAWFKIVAWSNKCLQGLTIF